MTTDNVTSPNEDVVDILTADHREMTELLARATQTQDAEQRRDLVETAIAEVMRHAVAEEMYVYPVMEKHLPNGKEEVEHDKQEHDEIVQVMKKLEEADAVQRRAVRARTRVPRRPRTRGSCRGSGSQWAAPHARRRYGLLGDAPRPGKPGTLVSQLWRREWGGTGSSHA